MIITIYQNKLVLLITILTILLLGYGCNRRANETVSGPPGPATWADTQNETGGEDVLTPYEMELKKFLQTRGEGPISGQNVSDDQVRELADLRQKYKFTVEEQNAYEMGNHYGLLTLDDQNAEYYREAIRKQNIYRRKAKRMFNRWHRERMRNARKLMSKEDIKARRIQHRRTRRRMAGKNPYTIWERLFDPSKRSATRRSSGRRR